MYDELIKIDLEKVKTETKYPSFVVFQDGRVVRSDECSHGQTVIKTCRKYYPEWGRKFDKMIEERFGDFDEDMTEEERERYSCMLVLNGEYLEKRGFILLHNMLDKLLIFGFPKMTKEQVNSLSKIDKVFKISGWPNHYLEEGEFND